MEQMVPTPVALQRVLSWVPTPITLWQLHWVWFRFGHTQVWVWAPFDAVNFIKGTTPATTNLKKPRAYEHKKGQYDHQREQNHKWSPTKGNKIRIPNPKEPRNKAWIAGP